MKTSALLLAIGISLCTVPTASPAADSGTIVFKPDAMPPLQLKFLRLDGEDALAKLQHSNPRHYQIARRILAAGNEVCNATQPAPMKMKFDVQDIHCAQSWYTSNPPKRVLEFRIDDTVYTALITVPETHAKLDSVH
jgi:hypothetical protein